jgi:hypothetical protein
VLAAPPLAYVHAFAAAARVASTAGSRSLQRLQLMVSAQYPTTAISGNTTTRARCSRARSTNLESPWEVESFSRALYDCFSSVLAVLHTKQTGGAAWK